MTTCRPASVLLLINECYLLLQLPDRILNFLNFFNQPEYVGYWRLLGDIARYCRILKDIGGYWRILGNIVRYWRILEDIGYYWRILGNNVRYWRLLEVIGGYWRILEDIGGYYWSILEDSKGDEDEDQGHRFRSTSPTILIY